MNTDDDLTVIRCSQCHGIGIHADRTCRKCAGTGKLFWVEAYLFPCDPQGEKQARRWRAWSVCA